MTTQLMAAEVRSATAVAAVRSSTTAVAAVPRVGVRVLGSDALSHEGVVRFLQECPEVRVVGDVGAGAPAGHGDEDVVVVVVDRVSDGTVRLLRSISEGSGSRIVLLVGHLDADGTASVVQAGAVGIMRRSEVTRSGLRQLIRSVVAGEAVVPPDILASLLAPSHEIAGGVRHLNVVGLTDREVKVLSLLSEGSDTREIATRLCYSERTVKTIIQDITHRFGLRNRSHAVAYALRRGMI